MKAKAIIRDKSRDSHWNFKKSLSGLFITPSDAALLSIEVEILDIDACE